MKLFRYQNFIKESNEDIHSICRKYDIINYTINEDGSVDVDSYVNLHCEGLSEFPLKFGKVSGYFSCGNNKLTSLSGAPREVGGDFHCAKNKLISLEGSPEKVVGNFYCHYNKLTSLSGISQYISGNIDCRYNELRDVKGIKDGWSGRFSIITSSFPLTAHMPRNTPMVLKIPTPNPVYEIFKLFPKERWDEVIEFLNEYDVIRNGKLVILQRLEQVFHDMGLEVPEIEEIEGYEIQY